MGTYVLAWNLLWPCTQTVQDFAVEFGQGWFMSGEMRIDQAQSIAAQ
jgi:EAL domain-containing protein (putative c-di-GMP-specific phosphodiesterase class I)